MGWWRAVGGNERHHFVRLSTSFMAPTVGALTFYWLKKKTCGSGCQLPHVPFYLRKMKVFLVENVFN